MRGCDARAIGGAVQYRLEKRAAEKGKMLVAHGELTKFAIYNQ